MEFRIRFAWLVGILLIGVILGLMTAERGIHKIDGLPEQKPQTFAITKIDQGQVEIAVMGKQVKANPERMTNYVSHTGVSMGSFIKSTTRSMIDWMASFFEP